MALWRLESPPGLQLPKWEFTWEWECSFSHTLLHSQPPGNMKCDSWASLLVRTLASPCFGCEPKARVVITSLSCLLFPSQSSSTSLYSKVLRTREHALDSLLFHYFCFRLTFESIKELGSVLECNAMAVVDLHLWLLLFADDLVLMSNSKVGL
jgi:hypothetical protein